MFNFYINQKREVKHKEEETVEKAAISALQT
jgi:hypothetical protein